NRDRVKILLQSGQTVLAALERYPQEPQTARRSSQAKFRAATESGSLRGLAMRFRPRRDANSARLSRAAPGEERSKSGPKACDSLGAHIDSPAAELFGKTSCRYSKPMRCRQEQAKSSLR